MSRHAPLLTPVLKWAVHFEHVYELLGAFPSHDSVVMREESFSNGSEYELSMLNSPRGAEKALNEFAAFRN
jgi:hypothetical protein